MEQKQIKLEDMSSERLALLLNQQYNTIMQSQQNILQINAALQQREIKNADANTNAADGSSGTIPQAPVGD